MIFFLLGIWLSYVIDFTCSLRRSTQRIYLSGLFFLLFSLFFNILVLFFGLNLDFNGNLGFFLFTNNEYCWYMDSFIFFVLFLGLIVYLSLFDRKWLILWRKEEIFLFLTLLITVCWLFFIGDFLGFILLIELQTFIILLLMFGFGFLRQIEAVLKYFLLSGVSASINVIGITLIFFELGVFNFSDIVFLIESELWFNIKQNFTNSLNNSSNFIFLFDDFLLLFNIGLIGIFFNLFFKLGIIGFHQWVPDVYEGSSEIGFISLIIFSKLVGFFLVFRFFFLFFSLSIYKIWLSFIIIFAIISIYVSLLHNLYQFKIRRFLAYSSIGQSGYILFCLLLNNLEGLLFGILLTFFYIISLLNFVIFISLIIYIDNGFTIQHIREFGSLCNNNIFFGIYLLGIFLNLIGLPPFFNFLFKFFLLASVSVVNNNMYWIGILIFFLLSIQVMFYYLRFIRFLLIDSLSWNRRSIRPISELKGVLLVGILSFNFIFIIYIDYILLFLFNWIVV